MNQRDKEIRAYATALLEAVVEEALTALRSLEERLRRDEALRAFLEDPERDVGEKYAKIREIVPPGTGEAVIKFLGLLISRQDLGYLDEIIAAAQKQAEKTGEAPTLAVVVSAVPLTEEERKALEAKVRQHFRDRIKGPLVFEYRVDPDILGGLIVRVGDTLIDYSLRSRLEELRHRLEEIV